MVFIKVNLLLVKYKKFKIFLPYIINLKILIISKVDLPIKWRMEQEFSYLMTTTFI